MAALERGGNAFDAAVTAGFVLQVVEPHLNGPGGEVPILLYSAERDEVLVVCGQGVAPAAATIERFGDLGLELVPGTGLLPACVPGAFDAWLLLLRDFGTLRARATCSSPRSATRETATRSSRDRSTIASMERMFRDEWPGSARALPACAGAQARSSATARWRRPSGACSTRRAAGAARRQIDAARDAFYRGFVAEAIASFAARRGDGQLGAQAPRAADRRRPRRWQASVEAAGRARLRGLARLQDRALGPGPGLPAAARAARAASTSGRSGARAPTSSTPWSSARSSRSPTARRGTATRPSPTCRSTSC